jgi:hypothetical protein
MSGERLTRRQFVARAVAAGSIVGSVPALALTRAAVPRQAAASASVSSAVSSRIGEVVPVVSFHLDRPYVDLSGEAIPYRPPAGARGGEAIAELGEADRFRLPL